jgi:hypothetical protein
VLRQFADPEVRDARFVARQASGRHALVIGNPPAENAPDLPGASEEARRVKSLLSRPGPEGSEFEVCSLIWKDQIPRVSGPPEIEDSQAWTHILNALFRHEWRIIHIAAHGAFDAEHPESSGVLTGPNHFLTAQTIGQLGAVPELVFINCCHSGRTSGAASATAAGPNVHRLAAGVARELMGARRACNRRSRLVCQRRRRSCLRHDLLRADAGRGLRVRRRGEASPPKGPRKESLNDLATYQFYGDPEFRLDFEP